MTLQKFWEAYTGEDEAMFPVTGHCMEGMDICDGDYVRVSFKKMPLPPRGDGKDACLCYGVMHNKGNHEPHTLMIKGYGGVWGWMQQVHTCYKYESKHWRMNYTFEPILILGVVSACYDKDMVLKWERDVSSYPSRLGREATIKGLNPVKTKDVIAAGGA